MKLHPVFYLVQKIDLCLFLKKMMINFLIENAKMEIRYKFRNRKLLSSIDGVFNWSMIDDQMKFWYKFRHEIMTCFFPYKLVNTQPTLTLPFKYFASPLFLQLCKQRSSKCAYFTKYLEYLLRRSVSWKCKQLWNIHS